MPIPKFDKKPSYDELLAMYQREYLRRQELEEAQTVSIELLRNLVRPLAEQFSEEARKWLIGEPHQDAELVRGITIILRDVARLSLENTTFRKMFARKSEKLFATPNSNLPKETEAALQPVVELEKEADGLEKEGQKVARGFEKALGKPGGKMPASKAGSAIAHGLSLPTPPKPSARKGSKGKRSLRKTSIQPKPVALGVCEVCGKPLSPDYEWLERIRDLHTRHEKALEKLVELKSKIVVGKCECGHIQVVLSEGADVPVVPGRSIGTSTLNFAANMLTYGMPLYRVEDCFFNGECLGNSVIRANLYTLCESVYARLERDIVEGGLGEAEACMMDETTYPCMESQGRGRVAKAKRDAAEKAEAEAANDSTQPDAAQGAKKKETSSEQRSLVIRSVPCADRKFVIYKFLKTKSAENIIKAIGPAPFKGFVSDAYSGYQSKKFQAQYPEAEQQCCLVHWRRTLKEALNIQSLDEASEKFEKQHPGQNYIAFHLEKETPEILLLGVAYLLNRLYAWEKTLVREPGEELERYLQRVQACRSGVPTELMNDIDVVMQELGKRVAKQNRGGAWVKAKAEKYADCVVYYLNQRDRLRTFLTNPLLPSENNASEQAIRSKVVLRNNQFFMQSERGMKNICRIFTVFETLRANGVEDPTAWLNNYCQLYFKRMIAHNLGPRIGTMGDALGKRPRLPWDIGTVNDDGGDKDVAPDNGEIDMPSLWELLPEL